MNAIVWILRQLGMKLMHQSHVHRTLQTNVVNVVVMDLAKDTLKVAHDSVLTTVINRLLQMIEN